METASVLVLILSLASAKLGSVSHPSPSVLQYRVGDKIKATVTWKNTGNTIVTVPADEGWSQVDYILTDTHSGKSIPISARLREIRTSPGEPNFTQPPGVNLGPGSSTSREEELLELAGDQIKVGSYEVVAHYSMGKREVTSNTVKFKVER